MATYSKFGVKPAWEKLTTGQSTNPYSGVTQPAGVGIEALPPRPQQPAVADFGAWPDYARRLQEWASLRDSLIAGGVNPDGSPVAPEFQSMIDPETGRLKGGLQMSLEGVPGYEDFTEFATGTGPSRFAQAAQEELGLKAAMERDRATREAQQAYGMARGNMAMRGGITTGSSERLARNAMTDAMEGRQRVRGGEMSGLASILTQDAGARQGALRDLVGMGADVEQFNVGAALDEIGGERSSAWKTYEEKGKAWAAKKKAEAMRHSNQGGGGGCFITTACCEILGLPDDNAILNTFRKFRDEHLGGKEGVAEYYELAPKIVEAMREKNELDELYDVIGMYLLPCHKAIKNGEFDRAYALYGVMFNDLKKEYLGE